MPGAPKPKLTVTITANVCGDPLTAGERVYALLKELNDTVGRVCNEVTLDASLTPPPQPIEAQHFRRQAGPGRRVERVA